MTHDLGLSEVQKQWHGNLKSYAIGFSVSLLLTTISFFLVVKKVLPPQILMYTIIALGLVQAVIQLLFFMHIGGEEVKPRWQSIALCFTALILSIVVIGSLWIMNDLNERMMPEMSMPSMDIKKDMIHD